jgi:hypothetical protein
MGHAQAAFPGSGALSTLAAKSVMLHYTSTPGALQCLRVRCTAIIPPRLIAVEQAEPAAVAPSWTWAVGPHSPAA